LKTIVKLLIVVAILHACARAGRSSWRYYEFKDAIEQEARFAGSEPAAAVRQRILRIAEEQGITLLPADLVVEKDGTQTTVRALYGEDVELVPRLYTREFVYEFEVSVHPVRPLTAEDFR
jgi:hypothetical protein